MSEYDRAASSFTTESVKVKQPNAARMYDYLLGGSANFEVDRRTMEEMLRLFPDTAHYIRTNRAFLGRAVRYLADVGLDQFLDLGSGMPTVGNVHEIAHQRNPHARVVYVDHEPVAVHHARQLLHRYELQVAVAEADIREPEVVLNAPEVRALLDFSRPIGLLAIGVLPFVLGEQANTSLEHYRSKIPPGSYAVLSHLAQLGMSDEEAAAGIEIMARTPTPEQPRTREEIEALLDGYTILEPGVVPVPMWRPEKQPTEDEINRSNSYAAVGYRA